ncbi:MAG: hypothetical protein HZA31_09015 [Opitutae bacterium]|nr:hypothetical protein [Opitutae bacterium]
MNKAYVLVPLIAVILFGGYYYSFSTAYEKKELAQKAAEKEAHNAKLRKEAADREIAIKAAVEADKTRKEEKAKKEAKDKAEKEARAAAVEQRNKAQRDQGKLETQKFRLSKDVEALKEEIAKIEAEKVRAVSEAEFLKVYVKEAEANVKGLTAVLDKIESANRAKAEFDRQAAAAAKAKS